MFLTEYDEEAHMRMMREEEREEGREEGEGLEEGRALAMISVIRGIQKKIWEQILPQRFFTSLKRMLNGLPD
ncbi:MAG: hypothetical protein Q4C73_09330 [Eubacteriales bacterium]|nr:hypothetical protein [Eubacteriales bacterium]